MAFPTNGHANGPSNCHDKRIICAFFLIKYKHMNTKNIINKNIFLSKIHNTKLLTNFCVNKSEMQLKNCLQYFLYLYWSIANDDFALIFYRLN